MSHDIIRQYPWDSVPKWKQVRKRRSRYYYLLTMHLRENPPDEVAFRIKNLMEEFSTDYPTVYQTLRVYIDDSKFFLQNVIIPEAVVRDEKTWDWAIKQLHKEGFYMVQPFAYHSGLWSEPSFRQFEDYDEKYLQEAFNRVLYRLRDGMKFGFTFDGLDIRKELEYVKRRREMLEDKTEDEE